MIINHNQSAEFASRQLKANEAAIQNSIEKLTTGSRINKASDDPSELFFVTKLHAQIRGYHKASYNIQNGMSALQTADEYLNETIGIVHRIRELSVQYANGLYSDEERAMAQNEANQLIEQIDRMSKNAQWNGINLLTGAYGKDGDRYLQIQTGPNLNSSVEISIESNTAESLGLKAKDQSNDNGVTISFKDVESSERSIGIASEALRIANFNRSQIGVAYESLAASHRNVDVALENLSNSESKIKDVNIATEIVDSTKHRILAEMSQSLIAQANSYSQNVLALLK